MEEPTNKERMVRLFARGIKRDFIIKRDFSLDKKGRTRKRKRELGRENWAGHCAGVKDHMKPSGGKEVVGFGDHKCPTCRFKVFALQVPSILSETLILRNDH